MFDPKNIIIVCTDGEGTYSGDFTGMARRMKGDPNYHTRVLHLSDICHLIEIVVGKNLATFVELTLDDCSKIYNNFSSKNNSTQHFYEYNINNESNKVFRAVYGMSDTRYIQFAHQHIESILRNLPIWLKKFKVILEDSKLSDLHKKSQEVYDIIRDPVLQGYY